MQSNTHRPLCEPLEGRLLCQIVSNGEFVSAPPGGGQGQETIHQQPAEGLIGLRTAREQSGGVVNWQITSTHESLPGIHSALVKATKSASASQAPAAGFRTELPVVQNGCC